MRPDADRDVDPGFFVAILLKQISENMIKGDNNYE